MSVRDVDNREARLLERGLQGDREAIGRLLELHYPVMMRVARKYTGAGRWLKMRSKTPVFR